MTNFCISCIRVTAFITTSMNLVLARFKVSLLAINHLFMMEKIRFNTSTVSSSWIIDYFTLSSACRTGAQIKLLSKL